MDMEKRHVIFIRHGESQRNSDKYKIEGDVDFAQKSKKYYEGKYDPKHFDIDLTSKGVQQCKNTFQKLREIDFKAVLVSPMRRALKTCNQIFKNHPSKPLIIVQPLLTQKIHSTTNLGTSLKESMQMFPDFDYHKVEGQENNWYIHLLQKNKKQKLLKLLQASGSQTGEQVGYLILDSQKQDFVNLQNQSQAKQRGKKIHQLLEYYHNMYDGKIAYVGHSKITKLMTNTDHKIKSNYPNCAPLVYNLDQKQIYHIEKS